MEAQVLERRDVERIGHGHHQRRAPFHTHRQCGVLARQLLANQRQCLLVGRLLVEVDQRQAELLVQGLHQRGFGEDPEAHQRGAEQLARSALLLNGVGEILRSNDVGLDQHVAEALVGLAHGGSSSWTGKLSAGRRRGSRKVCPVKGGVLVALESAMLACLPCPNRPPAPRRSSRRPRPRKTSIPFWPTWPSAPPRRASTTWCGRRVAMPASSCAAKWRASGCSGAGVGVSSRATSPRAITPRSNTGWPRTKALPAGWFRAAVRCVWDRESCRRASWVRRRPSARRSWCRSSAGARPLPRSSVWIGATAHRSTTATSSGSRKKPTISRWRSTTRC